MTSATGTPKLYLVYLSVPILGNFPDSNLPKVGSSLYRVNDPVNNFIFLPILHSKELLVWSSMELFSRRRWTAQKPNMYGMFPCVCCIFFLVFYINNSLTLGPIQPSFPSTKELHGSSLVQTLSPKWNTVRLIVMGHSDGSCKTQKGSLSWNARIKRRLLDISPSYCILRSKLCRSE